jgi:4-hydroxy-tetrahydrodipicolinate reductase
MLRAGVNVVSTCEELSYPYRDAPDAAEVLHQTALAGGATVLATGVNPGFLMDTWPLFLSGTCESVDRVEVVRVQDSSARRLPFQAKIGTGKSPTAFRDLVEAGSIRHVGLRESIASVAAGLGWVLTRVEEDVEPVIASADVQTPQSLVRQGQVAGVRQVGRGWVNGREAIVLDFQAFAGAPRSFDEVRLFGVPDLHVVVEGGVHGDLATAAIVVNAGRRVVAAAPGLITMPDLPLVTCGAGSQ